MVPHRQAERYKLSPPANLNARGQADIELRRQLPPNAEIQQGEQALRG